MHRKISVDFIPMACYSDDRVGILVIVGRPHHKLTEGCPELICVKTQQDPTLSGGSVINELTLPMAEIDVS